MQFIGQNDIGTISKPSHWFNSNISGDHLTLDVDLDISHSDAGVYIQIQTENIATKVQNNHILGNYC